MVRYSTLIFLVMLISGIILWWPRNKAALKQRYWFRWKQSTQWKRKNYDLHNVLGFYVSWVVVFMAITGLVWSFTWFDKGLYYLLSGGEVSAEPSKRVSDTLTTTNAGQLERSFARFQREHPAAYQQANAFYISYPTSRRFTASGFLVTRLMLPPGSTDENEAVAGPLMTSTRSILVVNGCRK